MARPTKYNPEIHPALAEAWASAGKVDKEIAAKLGISEATLNTWKKEHSEFLESIKRGKAAPDDNVERSLYERAIGYSFNSEKILTVNDGHGLGSHIERVPVVEHCPPDPTAIIFFLTNRRPEKWRRRGELKLETPPASEGGTAFALVEKRSIEEWEKHFEHGNPSPDKPRPSPAQPSSSSTAGRKAAGSRTSSSGTSSRASKSTAKRGKASSSAARTKSSKRS
jgi:hypothetical protein